MITPLEILAFALVLILIASGLFVSIEDAVQLEQTLNLNLTQTVVMSQSIVNLQREVQLAHNEVTRLLGGLDNPPEPITRFDFVKIQVNNLALQVDSPEIKFIFTDEDLALVQDIEKSSSSIDQLITIWQQAVTKADQITPLKTLDTQLEQMETTIKQLIDRQATTQRETITQTRDTLRTSQRTTLIVASVLLLMTVALIIVVRQGLSSRLQQAVEADRLKSQLLTSVSHELRTPLNAIKGYAQLLNDEAYGSTTNEQKTTFQRILINTTQLQGMVNNLLDRAQIEQGKVTLQKSPFAPADLIETAHSALSILAKTKGLALTSEITPDVPAKLIGDVLRLQQILFNLISNALKFTESGSVHARIFLPDKAHWALQVIDTGIGIPSVAQADVFKSFWQVDSSATRQYRGSGLGLSIVKQLADLMQAEITLTSQPGTGSTFTVIFPMESKS
ncbi:MAG: ATP-binding protein [Chloroflexota bacterium]